MKKLSPCIITLSRLAILLLCSSLLVGCTVVLPNSYSKAREKTQKILAHNGFKGKVQVKNIKKVFLDIVGFYVDYTYSEETYDNQTISLDSQITFNQDWTVNGEEYKTPDHYWESYLQQKTVKKEEQKLFKELKKQSLGLDIVDFSFSDNTLIDQEAGNRRKHIAEENRKNGKSDFYGYYQIPYQTMIDEHLVTMRIEVGDTENTSKKDLEEAATKLDASKLPDGEYEFYYFTTDKENSAYYDNSGYIGYTFNIQDGKVIQDDDD
ncbi:hypothetical protein H7T95_03195 [Streptococcus salivarius]|uniref:hypothetical protein n=1 Tax=Streptococcus salivarius TaxID=1304 RepID=UPI0019141F4C|nr:hypothetical protein [Streptococcus salivarius]MBK5128489.1 hypothetical protein [Streptococcus salivarius]